MNIFADKNIFAVESSFERYGKLHLFNGRDLVKSNLIKADALLVRSITRVDEQLLSGTDIRFVGSATSGTDHVDLEYLKRRDIKFVDAKGSNANAVVDYCFSALAYAILYKGLDIENSMVGIVGAGNVGGLFAQKLKELGIRFRLYDPFLVEQIEARYIKEDSAYCSLSEILCCDVVSLHTPLTTVGPYPTKNLIDARELGLLSSTALLINTCRGGVVNEEALKQFLLNQNDLVCVFDVWADEPLIDHDLANAVDIATPHIAGYSSEAKSAATQRLLEAFRLFFAPQSASNEGENQHKPHFTPVVASSTASSGLTAVLEAFPLNHLADQFKSDLNGELEKQAFDVFREKLSSRREFRNHLLSKANYTDVQSKFLSVLGFQLS